MVIRIGIERAVPVDARRETAERVGPDVTQLLVEVATTLTRCHLVPEPVIGLALTHDDVVLKVRAHSVSISVIRRWRILQVVLFHAQRVGTESRRRAVVLPCQPRDALVREVVLMVGLDWILSIEFSRPPVDAQRVEDHAITGIEQAISLTRHLNRALVHPVGTWFEHGGWHREPPPAEHANGRRIDRTGLNTERDERLVGNTIESPLRDRHLHPVGRRVEGILIATTRSFRTTADTAPGPAAFVVQEGRAEHSLPSRRVFTWAAIFTRSTSLKPTECQPRLDPPL